MNLFTGSFLLIMCMLVELPMLKYLKKDEIPWREIVYNVSSGHILMWICRALEVLLFTYVLTHLSFGLLDSWNFVAQWVFTFFAWDLCFYWLHRLHHKIPLFWKIHVVHHQGEHFSLSLGLRNSWYSSLSSIPFFIILAVIGVPVPVFISVASVHYFVQFYNHNGVVKNSGVLERFMVTPALHRVHHGVNPEYIDKNCGGTLNLWDRLFGTFQREIEGVPIQYGVIGAIKTDNPFWGNNLPFMQALKMKIPDFKKQQESKLIVPDLFIATGGLSLLSLWLYYIFCEGHGLGMQQVVFFNLIFLGTIALGALSDGRFWGMMSWIFLSSVPSVIFVAYFNIYNSWAIIWFVLFFLHGIYGLKYVLKENMKRKLNTEYN
jgi:sterol desaturase/sphingolipid hydroxylase (fatty acid hydroxylase superfamily)